MGPVPVTAAAHALFELAPVDSATEVEFPAGNGADFVETANVVELAAGTELPTVAGTDEGNATLAEAEESQLLLEVLFCMRPFEVPE